MEVFKEWLINFSRVSAFAGILYFSFNSKGKKKVSWAIFLVLLISFLADNANYFIIHLVYPNSFIVGNIWIVLNFLVITWLFANALPEREKTIRYLVIFFLLCSIIGFSSYSLLESNPFTSVSSNILLIIIPLLTYFDLLHNPSNRLSRLPLFWIATSFFIYNSLVLLQSVFDSYLIFDMKISASAYRVISIINLLANITKNFILFYAIVLIDKGYPDSIKPANAT